MPIPQTYRINPLDLQPNIAIGVKLPFNGKAVFNSTFKTEDQIKYNLINFILTNKGERIENPEFGSDLRRFLFEFIVEENINDIKSSLIEGIKKYVPEVVVTNINITSYEDQNTIVIDLFYKIKLSGNSDNITLNFN